MFREGHFWQKVGVYRKVDNQVVRLVELRKFTVSLSISFGVAVR